MFGIKICKQGKSVWDKEKEDISFDSKFPYINIFMVKKIKHKFTDNPESLVLTYPHRLGYIPFSYATFLDVDSFNENHRPGDSGFLPWRNYGGFLYSQDWEFGADEKNFYLTFTQETYIEPPPSIQGASFEFKIYAAINKAQ